KPKVLLLVFMAGFGIIIFMIAFEARPNSESLTPNSESVFYYHNDHLGTPKVLTDQNGTIQWEAVMEPFGEIDTFIASNANNPFRFPGQYEDDLTGLYYNHHRYYIPGLSRYNKNDPLLYYTSNKYKYSRNNPINMFDIHGLEECKYIGRNLICEEEIGRKFMGDYLFVKLVVSITGDPMFTWCEWQRRWDVTYKQRFKDLLLCKDECTGKWKLKWGDEYFENIIKREVWRKITMAAMWVKEYCCTNPWTGENICNDYPIP
ncbi:TPA: hypothetical protein ENX78_05470, partial [Candidatus Poribacteria bacterium]|nr:hypothetical protein [Candidatus Poribacteria bacterium]